MRTKIRHFLADPQGYGLRSLLASTVGLLGCGAVAGLFPASARDLVFICLMLALFAACFVVPWYLQRQDGEPVPPSNCRRGDHGSTRPTRGRRHQR